MLVYPAGPKGTGFSRPTARELYRGHTFVPNAPRLTFQSLKRRGALVAGPVGGGDERDVEQAQPRARRRKSRGEPLASMLGTPSDGLVSCAFLPQEAHLTDVTRPPFPSTAARCHRSISTRRGGVRVSGGRGKTELAAAVGERSFGLAGEVVQIPRFGGVMMDTEYKRLTWRKDEGRRTREAANVSHH